MKYSGEKDSGMETLLGPIYQAGFYEACFLRGFSSAHECVEEESIVKIAVQTDASCLHQ